MGADLTAATRRIVRDLLAQHPGDGAALNLAGVLAYLDGDLQPAADALTAAAGFGVAGAQNSLGVALMKLGRTRDAVEAFRTALLRDPDDAQAGYNLAMALLARGAWEEGFRLYEWRWVLKGPPPWLKRGWGQFWMGERLDGRTLLVHAEQGLGDTIQFARYLVPARERAGARVVVGAPRPLHRLLAGAPGVDAVVGEGDRLPAFAAHVPLMSLPLVLGLTGPGDVPRAIPYLTVPPAVERAPGKPRIGLVWAGNRADPDDRYRSIALEELAPLFAMPGVEWHSLQIGEDGRALDALPAGAVRPLAAQPADFTDTAAVIRGLDLVVTVDTATAHLAGAMGCPVWLLLSAQPDWRWLQARADTPWYPGMRIFRQERLGDWRSVVAGVGTALAERFGQ
ncbi:tetratricopeptide repeat protein [Azospirillum sp. sgz301742]